MNIFIQEKQEDKEITIVQMRRTVSEKESECVWKREKEWASEQEINVS